MQRDLVLRWIESISRLIARLLGRRDEAAMAEAEARLAEAMAQLLGPIEPVAARLTAASAAELLHDPARIFGYARLLALAGALAETRGESDLARTAKERAVELGREAVRRDAEPPSEWTDWVDRAATDLARPPGERGPDTLGKL
jgi:hypothetical protein